MNDKVIKILNELSTEINKLYGYVTIKGDNEGEPAINSGPCGIFANLFYHCWNERFNEKIHIVFIMVKDSDECWHIMVRLPNGMLYDGGYGVQDENKFNDKYQKDEGKHNIKIIIEDMIDYEYLLLDKRSYGLDREFSRLCPNFEITEIKELIERYLDDAKNYV
ncbi:MAG: hypothetical protein P4L35_14315 [Ignavibacteriaceae bacterium]|nr:hypothetical protein [Ignavibacteriaceae bacterium]